MDGTPLVLQLTAEMIDLEEHGSSQHKENSLTSVATLESEKFSVVSSSGSYKDTCLHVQTCNLPSLLLHVHLF
jgi:hypothetical protein